MALRKIFKEVIIPQIAYRASILHLASDKKGHCKTLVTQLAQVQALGACVISEVFKITSVQVLNINVYFTSIEMELDKKADQTATWLYLGLFYSTITQNKSVHLRSLLTPLKTLKKRHIRMLKSSISELEKRPAYITA